MKTWILAFAAGLLIGAIGTSVAAPRSGRVGGFSLRPNQSGIFVWSPSTRRYMPLDRIVISIQSGHNDLVRRVSELENRAGN